MKTRSISNAGNDIPLVTIYFSVFYKAEDNNKHADQSYTVEKNTSPK